MFGKSTKLKNKKVAIVATDGFEESELFEPREALLKEGADVDIISVKPGKIKAWKKDDWGRSIFVDHTVDEVSPQEYDALMLPGGVINADRLRMQKEVVDFVKEFAESGKPIAAICHAPWTLIETGYVRGHTITSWPSLQSDLKNAGARWVDEEVVTDNGWVTSRKPSDIPAFNKKMIEEFSEGSHRSNPSVGMSLSPSDEFGEVYTE
jgi:protease I